MRSLRFGLFVGCLVLSLAVVAAQESTPAKDDKKPDEKKLKGYLPPNFKKLGLLEDQVQKIYKIRADYKDKIEDLKAKIEKLKDEEKDAIEKVLNKDQLKRLREIQTGEKAK